MQTRFETEIVSVLKHVQALLRELPETDPSELLYSIGAAEAGIAEILKGLHASDAPFSSPGKLQGQVEVPDRLQPLLSMR